MHAQIAIAKIITHSSIITQDRKIGCFIDNFAGASHSILQFFSFDQRTEIFRTHLEEPLTAEELLFKCYGANPL